MRNNTIINFFAPPRTGKSTISAWLFSQLKLRNISTELITEVTKECSFQRSSLAVNPVYLLAMQYTKLKTFSYCQFTINDIPLPQFIVYYNTSKEYNDFCISLFNEFNNVNYLLKRSTSNLNYEQMMPKIINVMDKYSIPYTEINLNNPNAYELFLNNNSIFKQEHST